MHQFVTIFSKGKCNYSLLLNFNLKSLKVQGGNHIDYEELARKVKKSVSTIKKWRSKIETLSGYEFSFYKVPIGRTRGYNWKPNFTHDEALKFSEVAKMLADKTKLDEAIKQVWGDLNARLEQERVNSQIKTAISLNTLKRSQNDLSNNVTDLSKETFEIRKRVHTLENELSSLIEKLSENRKLKKLIE